MCKALEIQQYTCVFEREDMMQKFITKYEIIFLHNML